MLVGVTCAARSAVDRTDAALNKERHVCAFFNGKAFGPGKSFPLLTAPMDEIVVRLDIDKGELSFAPSADAFGEPAFRDLPKGVAWLPYFSLGTECSIMVI